MRDGAVHYNTSFVVLSCFVLCGVVLSCLARLAFSTPPPHPVRIAVWQDVTITRTDNKTGEVLEVTRPMTTVERTEVDLPKHLQKAFEAQRKGKEWKDTRRSKGRWGPTPDEKVRILIEGFMYRKSFSSIRVRVGWGRRPLVIT